MRYKFYTLSEDAISAMRDSISRATKSIYWESYIFQNDIIPTHNFIELLTLKAQAGLRVKLILDGFGSYYLEPREIEALRAVGGEVLFFTHWFRRIHRKLLIIDERIAFLGGVNVGRQYVKWLDLHLRLSGKMLKALIKTFAKSYRLCGGEDPQLLRAAEKVLSIKKTKIWLVEHWPQAGKRHLRRHYEESIAAAQQKVTIVTPYFMPHRWLLQALKRAELRGVITEIVLPRETDPKIGDVANYLNASRLSSKSVRFYFTPEMIHAKALLIDDREGLVGSQNIDALSFDHNVEMSAVFQKRSMVRDLATIVEMWKSDAIPFERLGWQRRWYHWPLTLLLDLLQPVI